MFLSHLGLTLILCSGSVCAAEEESEVLCAEGGVGVDFSLLHKFIHNFHFHRSGIIEKYTVKIF